MNCSICNLRCDPTIGDHLCCLVARDERERDTKPVPMPDKLKDRKR